MFSSNVTNLKFKSSITSSLRDIKLYRDFYTFFAQKVKHVKKEMIGEPHKKLFQISHRPQKIYTEIFFCPLLFFAFFVSYFRNFHLDVLCLSTSNLCFASIASMFLVLSLSFFIFFISFGPVGLLCNHHIFIYRYFLKT